MSQMRKRGVGTAQGMKKPLADPLADSETPSLRLQAGSFFMKEI